MSYQEGMAEEKTDIELVELSLLDQENFIYLIKRYEHRLSAYIARLTKASAEDIEDILQDVFIKVYQNLNDFDKDLKFSSWIYRITHNQVISHYRKMQSRPEGSNIEIEDSVLENFASDIDPTSNMDKKLLRREIDRILDKLDRKYREVLVLKYFEEKDYNEMSDILKKPVGTIGTLLNRAKKLFQEQALKEKVKI